jgi:SAM-dependent methyltransferase
MSEKPNSYIYDPSSADERTRLTHLERLNDPSTIKYLEGVGVKPGWTCLEVGGGAGSITRWLSDAVGPEGRVVVTDIDTRFLEDIGAANVEVRRHDILEDDLEKDAFDLVHSRFLLEHLERYRDALQNMVDALKPGGWIVVEDVDFIAALMADPAQRPGIPEDTIAIGAALTERLTQMAQGRGIQTELGRHLPALLVEAGLEDVGAEGNMNLIWSTTEEAEVGRLSIEQVTKVAVAAGVMTEDDRARYMSLFDEPGRATFSPMRFGAWGRKPA